MWQGYNACLVQYGQKYLINVATYSSIIVTFVKKYYQCTLTKKSLSFVLLPCS